jgi:hypothetical protein
LFEREYKQAEPIFGLAQLNSFAALTLSIVSFAEEIGMMSQKVTKEKEKQRQTEIWNKVNKHSLVVS